MVLAPNQFLMYDTAVADWAHTNFGSCINDPTYFLIGTPDRAFAEYVTPTTHTPREGRPPLPRCSITLEDPILDSGRFNSNIIRKLGYVNSDKVKIRRAIYPVPINLPYTINFWTEKYREMNLFEQQLLKIFRFQYLQILVDIDSISPIPVYGKKFIELYIESGITNPGEVDPGKEERIVRRTCNFHAKAWIWDLDFQDAYSLKEVEIQTYRDQNLSLLLEVARTLQRDTIVASVSGSQLVFGPLYPTRTPIIQGTLLVDAIVGGVVVRGRDNTAGSIVDSVSGIVTGTVNYTTGEISLTYVTAPDAGTPITAGFYTTR